jgi:hypothetical protein
MLLVSGSVRLGVGGIPDASIFSCMTLDLKV